MGDVMVGGRGMTEGPTAGHSGDAASTVLSAVLEALDKSGCRYALLHADGNLNAAASSDIDIAFDRDPNRILVPILRELLDRFDARLVQCLHYEIPHGYYYVLRVDGGEPRFLHLDCLYDPWGVNRYRLSTSFLLADGDPVPPGIQVPRDRIAIYFLMKRAIKGHVSAQALTVLRAQFSPATESLWSNVRDWFGPDAQSEVERLLRSASDGETHSALEQLSAMANGRFELRTRFDTHYRYS